MAMLNNQMVADVADVADTTAACDISPVGSCWTILCQARWPERPERRVHGCGQADCSQVEDGANRSQSVRSHHLKKGEH